MDDSYLLTVESPPVETPFVEELLGFVRQLTTLVAVLTARLDQVQAENRQLKAEIVRKDARIAQLDVEQLKRRLFAPKFERAARSKSKRSNAVAELELNLSVTVRKRGHSALPACDVIADSDCPAKSSDAAVLSASA